MEMKIQIYKSKPEISIRTFTINGETYYALVASGEEITLEEVYTIENK